MPTQRAVAAPTLTNLLFDRADVGLCLVAPDGTILRANAEWLRSTGFSLDQVLGTDIINLFPATRDLSLALHARARAGNHVEVSRHAQFIEGGETWWEGCIDPVSMEGGAGLLIAAREVSHPERQGLPTDVSASLRHEQEKYRALFEHSLDAVYLILADGTFVDANAAACRMHGMTIEEIKERGCVGTVVRDERYAAALKERATSGNVRAELTHLRKDGPSSPSKSSPSSCAHSGRTRQRSSSPATSPSASAPRKRCATPRRASARSWTIARPLPGPKTRRAVTST